MMVIFPFWIALKHSIDNAGPEDRPLLAVLMIALVVFMLVLLFLDKIDSLRRRFRRKS